MTAARSAAHEGGGRAVPTEAQRTIRKAQRERHEVALLETLKRAGLPTPEREYRFASPRKYRADFAYPLAGILIEVEGGVHSGGRHTTGTGYTEDARKYNLAVALGWKVLRFTPEMIEDGTALETIERVLGRAA